MSDSKAGILVIRGGAIGDFILTMPALAALRAQFPTARLEVLGYAHIASLALPGLADAVRSIEAGPLAAFFARGGQLSEPMRDYFAKFALIISYLYDPDEIFRENIARCTKAQFIQGPHRPDESAGLHATEVFLKPLERLAIFDADPVPRLAPAGRAVPGHPAAPHTLALHPGSGSEKKNWPEARWAELLQQLGPNHCDQLLIVGGEAEGDRMNRLAARAQVPVEVVANVPLPELAIRLSQCQLFVGHDSGITHLAAALGLPGLVLWGETMEKVWHPRSPDMHLLRAGAGLGQLAAQEVIAALESRRRALP